MSGLVAPVLFSLFVWWLSTGVIFCAGAYGRRTMRWSMAVASLATVAAVVGLYVTRNDTTIAGAYCAFASALMIWGWHEMSFLFGYVTGPRRQACPPDARGWRRFLAASEVLIYHELAIAWTVVGLIWLTWGASNQLGIQLLLLLWGMRISAKLNLFLGVPNFSEEFLPKRLHYLSSYFAKRRMNALFPVSVAAGTALAVVLLSAAATASATPFEAAGYALLGTMAALATIEHWFLVLPLPDAALWRWLLPTKSEQRRPRRARVAVSAPLDPRR